MFWAYAFAAVFVYFAMKGLVKRCFDLTTLCWMALCAGLALLTRVSTGLGLSLAMLLLLLVLAVEAGKAAVGRWPTIWRAFTQRRIFVQLGILVALIGVTGAVNYFRWGNPTTFADYNFYISNNYRPDLLPRMRMYGLFNLNRIPFGLVYYFFPVWELHGSNGQLLLESTRTRLLNVAEPPPSSFFLTDLLPLCFIVLLAIALWRRRAVTLPLAQWVAVAIGLLAPCILMLTAIFMTYRYRMDFYPEIDFLAFLGLYLTVTDEAIMAAFARFRRWLAAALAVSIVASFAALALYDLYNLGPSQGRMRDRIMRYYGQPVARDYRRATHYFASHRWP